MDEKDYASKIKQMRNLAMFKNKTDEEILEWIHKREERQATEPDKPRPQKPVKSQEKTESDSDEAYDRLFNSKLETLQKEYGVDMNNSNDAEMLRSLARHLIQSEVVNTQIIGLQRQDTLDTRTLKNLGDYQKSVVQTITDLQEKLGIGRRQRKEKQLDSVPQFVEIVRTRARDLWNRTTNPVRCENCEVELARYWLNFPDKAAIISFEIECWKCGELVRYDR